MPNIPKKPPKQLAAVTAAAKRYEDACHAVAKAALVWWRRRGSTSTRSAQVPIDGPFVRAIRSCALAREALERALCLRPTGRRRGGKRPRVPRANR